ncbi:MAG: response regulator [Pseudomonadota bacterium]
MESARILLVDDEPVVARLYGRALANLGHQLEFASNGREGFEKAKSESFDLILTDLNMPHRTGTQMAEALTKRELKHCPIILLSATDSRDGLIEAVACGCDDFMQKGDSFQDILARARFWLTAPLQQLPDDARDIFVSRTPHAAAEITALRQLGRNRWQLEERVQSALLDQLTACPEGFGSSHQDQRRLLGVCAGLLDVLGRSDPISYLRRGDLLMSCLSACVPECMADIKAQLVDFKSCLIDATYRHARETLLLNPN